MTDDDRRRRRYPVVAPCRIGRVALIEGVFGSVLVPRGVWTELVEADPEARGVGELSVAAWIRVVDDPPPADLGLDAGETAAILLAEELHADLLLIDERRGRAVATQRGVTVVGTLGFLGAERQRGLVDRVRPLLDALREDGFWLAEDVVKAFLGSVGEPIE